MTVAIIGQALMLLALCATVCGCVLSVIGARHLVAAGDLPAGGLPSSDVPVDGLSSRDLPAGGPGKMARTPVARGMAFALAGTRAGQCAFGAALGGALLLLVALLTSNFTLSYVAGRTDLALPARYKLTAWWSGQEGSLLLWLTVLTLFAVLMVRSARRRLAPAGMVAYANAVLLGIASFFAVLVAFVARPFAVVDTLAADGAGMNPSLQNYWMAIHPPALYLGYVGVAVPFAIVMGSLLARRRDDAWVALTRRWSLLAWIGLTMGLFFGARWAYEEVGWGGYWAWDPVENAALMPWLTTTAFLHSVMVQQRRGMLRYWNVMLVSLSFSLSIFGTFLTRSGVLSSVHSFVSSSVGWWFIGFLGVVIAFSLVMLFRSRSLLGARHTLESVVSREAAFLFNNLLLVALALTVLWGVIFPILTSAFADQRVSLQGPWYNFFAIAFGLPLLGLMAIGPFVAWQRAKPGVVARELRAPFAIAVVVGTALLLAGHGTSVAGVAAVSFGAFVVAGVAAEYLRAVRARRQAQVELGWGAAARQAFARNRRRYGGYVAHAGLGLAVIAIAASSAFDSVVERDLVRGDTVRNGSYVLTFTGTTRRRTENSMQTRARFTAARWGRDIGAVIAGKNFYPASGEVSNEVGIRSSLLTGDDLFVIVDQLREDGRVHVKVIVNPLVNLLWLAGFVLVLGSCIAAWPGTREVGAGTGLARDDAPPVGDVDDDVPTAADARLIAPVT